MIKIQCSILEQVRKNPALHGQMLASNNGGSKGGSHGMFAYWQDVSLKVHSGEMNLNEGIKELQKLFSRFDETQKNLKKQDFLQDCFVQYHKLFEKNRYQLSDSKRRMNWNITSSGLLTGLTPWVIKNNDRYCTYFVSEQQFQWENELRFPLIQEYLAEKHSDEYDTTRLDVGIYCLETNTFNFKNFVREELNDAVEETVGIFEKVEKVYNIFKLTS